MSLVRRCGGISILSSLSLALALLFSHPARAGESQLGEEPVATDVRDLKGGFDEKGTLRGLPRLAALRRQVLPSWLHESQLDLHFRSYYFEREEDSDDPSVAEQDKAAWAYGGSAAWRSPWWFDRVALGASFFTSQRIWGPSQKDGTRLLATGQHGYSTLGVANLKLRHGGDDAILTLYRQELELPFLNAQDNRMTPNTFEGATLLGQLESFGYAAGWISRMKQRNENDFLPMSEVAGADDDDRGLLFAGVRFDPSERFQIGLINELTPDVLNTFYVESNFLHEFSCGLGLLLAGQLTDQRSVGEDLLGDGSFDTWRAGVRVALSYQNTGFSIAYARTDDEQAITSPYGSDPSYLSTMLDDFREAGDRALRLGVSHDFASVGVPGLSGVVSFAAGENDVGGGPGDRREVETTIDYRFGEGRFHGLWLRVRGGYLDAGDFGAGEVRLVLNYDLPVF